MQRELIEFYLEYMNDFLTIGNFTAWHGMDEETTNLLLDLGMKYHEMNTAYYKRMGYDLFPKKGN